MLGPNKSVCPKNLDEKNFWSEKFSGPKDFLGLKKFLVHRNFWAKKIWCPKKMWVQ